MQRALLPLGDDEAHVHWVRIAALTEPALWTEYEALMTDEEAARMGRYRFEKNQREFLVTRALVRTTLSRYAEVAPTAWRFHPNAHGCPRVSEPSEHRSLRFNLSNTDGLVAIVVSRGRDVGVDVEWLPRRGQTVEIADRFFSQAEVAELRAHPDEVQRRRFFDYWTLKEAYIKAREQGLSIPLSQFSFRLGPPVTISFGPELQDEPGSWKFGLMSPSPEHRLAWAVRAGGEPVRVAATEVVPLRMVRPPR